MTKEDCYSVCFLKLSMIGAPRVKLGTKCLHKIKGKRGTKRNMFNNLMVHTSTHKESVVVFINEKFKHHEVTPNHR